MNIKLHDLLLNKEWDIFPDFLAICKINGEDFNCILRDSLFHFGEKRIMKIIDTLCSKFGYNPLEDENYILLCDLINRGCLYPVLYILTLTNKSLSSDERFKVVAAESFRLTKKAKDEQSNYFVDPTDEFQDQPYSAFEWLLDEHGAPKISYFWSMYTSRAGYSDILSSYIHEMDPVVVNNDIIFTAISKFKTQEYDGVQ
jgi:hypothetical protein